MIDRVGRFYNRVSHLFRTSLVRLSKNVDVRPRFGWDFWTAFVGWVLLQVIFWYFSPLSELSYRVFLALFTFILPLGALFMESSDDEERRQVRWIWRGLVALSLFALLVGISAKWGLEPFGQYVSLGGISFGLLIFFWFLTLKKRLLGVAWMPSIFIVLIYAITLPSNDRLVAMLYLLFVVSLFSAPWIAVGYALLHFTSKWRKRYSIRGPGIECVTMVWLFVPAIWLVISATKTVTSDNTWLALTTTIVGVLIASVVSKPFRKFLLALGDL